MKKHIIGGSGSGKSTLAEKFSREYAVPHYDLDDLQWNAADTYGKKRDAAERDALLDAILQHDDWIIEGVYYTWCTRCFEEADRIYLLSTPVSLCKCRIIRRFIRRKLGREAGKKETLRDLTALLRWTDKYQRENLPAIRKLLAAYPDKVVELRDPSDAERKMLQQKE
ncbi:MAG: DNA topology modulation protein FlaR [Oscillospiraceae bacterium]|nr:DNA topology modulation protein FlaR [Oscillospiraceae bacterium]